MGPYGNYYHNTDICSFYISILVNMSYHSIGYIYLLTLHVFFFLKVWENVDCSIEFILSLWEVFRQQQPRSQQQQQEEEGSSSSEGKLVFDKDDLLSMRFVYAASNLRENVIIHITIQIFYLYFNTYHYV